MTAIASTHVSSRDTAALWGSLGHQAAAALQPSVVFPGSLCNTIANVVAFPTFHQIPFP